jgi:NAD(P)-dependent dehydrogenase (short-subunit alcohol dehydrogenase family)
LEVNVIGTLTMTQAAVPHLEARGGGAIVIIGSQGSMWPQVMMMPYQASKGALTSSALYLAKELGPSGIRVNTVVPTWMWGPPVEGYLRSVAASNNISLDDAIRTVTQHMMLDEIPADGDVAEAVVFFCSDRARTITGQSLMVNSGEYVR